MARSDVHTVPWEGKWANKRTGEKGAREIFRRQDQAIRAGRMVAKAAGVEHFIHRRNGSIRARNSYGNDPHPPKG